MTDNTTNNKTNNTTDINKDWDNLKKNILLFSIEEGL